MYSFNPFDSDTFPDAEVNSFEDNSQFTDMDDVPIVQYNVTPPDFFTDTGNVVTDSNEESIKITDVKNIKSVVSSLTNYKGGSLSNYLKNFPGLIVLPLSAVTLIRKPSGGHLFNPKILLYIPNKGIENYEHMQNFNQAIALINS